MLHCWLLCVRDASIIHYASRTYVFFVAKKKRPLIILRIFRTYNCLLKKVATRKVPYDREKMK